ncbi:HlyD family efflux transporter periplasmic adaptor subunit [Massilia sp. MS-15]|uniref:HlyD family efflux transporter periplasmic adaptor subunit n=1 Tax=Massilia sp. MS-15 TaxID=2878200 RepID=UPI001CD79E75|nr:HlyD family efflux transporter periplasmic adaptor subunit [Massilia sp. MS-15]MCA1245683.1 HlyD family efflux transporter periplasmic adaptor subunit [Massilia sp. MS-15]
MHYFTLPPLREELSLHRGPVQAAGEPSYTLEDPVRNQFFRIDWPTFEVLSRWSLGNPDDILLSLQADTPLDLERADVEAVLKFLNDAQLLRPDPLASSAALAARHQAAAGKWHTRLLHHYLFFRLPLVKPDAWLARMTPSFGWAFSRGFFLLTLLALVAGVALVWRQWDVFRSTLSGSFTPGGLLAYAIALTVVKGAHEMGHALSAKRHGCRVPTMGLAFLVLWPMPYTDTNDVWRLDRKDQRQQVALAGVATELIIAAWATLAWSLLPDGTLRDVVFPLATTTWIATLAINASPFMRFDGYFVLSDWLDMPNLHARAFALARWHLRECLFGLGEAPPEYFPARRHAGLILFAWAVWLYRLTVFIGIALLVYHFFIKLLGIFLFCVEMSWFVIRPIAGEFKVWRGLWPRIRASRRGRRSLVLAALALLLFVLPWPTRVQGGALLKPLQVFPVHAPEHAQLAGLPLGEGARVAPGQVLVRFAVPENGSRREVAEAQVERLRWQAGAAGFDAEQRARSAVLREELASAEAQLAAVDEESARYLPRAPFAGTLRDLDPELRPGTWLGRNERVAVLVGDGPLEVTTYLDEDAVRRIARGDRAVFHADGGAGPALRLRVAGIDRDATRILPASLWAAQQGGQVPAREKGGAWYPERAVYRVSFVPDAPADEARAAAAGHAWRGTVVIQGAWEAPGTRFARALATLFWREAGF